MVVVTAVLVLSACGKKEQPAAVANPSPTTTANATQATDTNPPPAPAVQLTAEQAAGETVYVDRCLRCHGEDGKTPQKSGLVLTDDKVMKKSDGELVKFILGPKLSERIRIGHSPNPITEDEAKQVVAYIRTLS